MTNPENSREIHLDGELRGERLDKALARLLPEYTRSAIQQWIRDGRVRVDGETAPQKHTLAGVETLSIDVPAAAPANWTPQPMDLDIRHEDAHLLVINKPPGLVVHPGAGVKDRTLLNGLVHHYPAMAELPRAGIVHRLDKGTSGLMVVAKTESARQELVRQLASRTVRREYIALVNGVMISGETIEQPIGRHSHNRLLMSVRPSGKPAVTHLKVLEKFRHHCLLQARLETGRTHQIRVHLAWRGYPIVGDARYSRRVVLPKGAPDELAAALGRVSRQTLHARKLSLAHPQSGEELTWECEEPDDIRELLDVLRRDGAAS